MVTKGFKIDYCLKNREKNVIKMHVEGRLSLRTVFTQICRLYEHLGCHYQDFVLNS